MKIRDIKIAIVGLGYVGLPLAVAFANKYKVIGYDVNQSRINNLKLNYDETLEIESDLICNVSKILNGELSGLHFTSSANDLSDCNVFIVTVPTPIDIYNRPVLTPMFEASKTIASFLKKGDLVIYESTVYPGVTEEEMAPLIERVSGLKYNQDFYCGYSPERINPGDKEHTVTKILKVTSGSTPEIAEFVDQLYKSVILAGTYKAPSIKVAEAAKVIENSQRDINIAFVNELSKIFNLLKIDTIEVLKAASTKWNFLKFSPGLVGGHCIGVDPYYLAQKAQEFGYHPEIILAGRRINDSMGKYVATEVIKLMLKKNISVNGSKILILGFTFKENCPDIRNTRVVDIYNELNSYDLEVEIFDPWVNPIDVMSEYGISVLTDISNVNVLEKFSTVILAVAHDKFNSLKIQTTLNNVVYDVKGVLNINEIDGRL